jgi:type IV pilus assembly protein PilC
MSEFKYRAKTRDDRIVEGLIEAETESLAKAILAEQKLVIIALEEKRKRILNLTVFSGSISRKDLVLFARQLSVMVGANVPIVNSLKTISEQTENAKLQNVISEIYVEVAAGTKLSDALARHPKYFDGFFINMLKSGETSGRLDEVLNYLADQLEKDFDLFRKVKGALMYPLVVVLGMIIAAIILMVYVIPKLVNVFTSMGVELPWTTKLLISTSDLFISYWWVLIILVIGGIVGIRGYLMTRVGQLTWSKIKLRIPIFGKLFQNIYILQITRSLSTLLVGGVDVVESLYIVRGVVQDLQYQDVVDKTILAVKDGQSIATVFLESKIMPRIVSNMLVIGEQTGRLDFILDKIGDYYSKEIDNTTNNMTSLMEPIIMVVLGIGVGIMVSAIFLPLYTLPSF